VCGRAAGGGRWPEWGGRPPPRLYYHLGQLEQAGLIPRPGARAVSTPAAS
jgi:hypothetical protein